MKKLLFLLLVLSVFTAQAQVPSYVPTNGLVAYYPFNGNANDASGNGYNGTVNGATLTSDRFGVSGKAYSFNGNKIITTFQGIAGKSSRTISFWYKTDSILNSNSINDQWCLVGYGGGGTNQCGSFFNCNLKSQSNNDLGLDVGASLNFFNTNSTPSLWHNFIITYDSTFGTNMQSAKVYVDGVFQSASNYTFGPNCILNSFLSFPLTFGANPNPAQGANNFIGKLDDIAIYNRALTQSEITGLYNSGTNTCLPSYLPTTGLVGYWPFCGNANDASGNGNNGSGFGGITQCPDRFLNSNSAYTFDGIDDAIEIPSNQSLLPTSNISFSFWINVPSNGTGYGHVIRSRFYGYIIFLNNNSLNFQLYHNSSYYTASTSNINLADNQWHHITLTFDGIANKLFIDGSLNASVASTVNGLFYSSDGLVVFGRDGNSYVSGTSHMKGKLDDIAIYNRALTSQEVSNLYSSSAPCIANITNNDTTICRGSSITLNAATVSPASVTDINGNVYPSVNIGAQTWSSKNLTVSKYKNGVAIPQVTDSATWRNLTTGAWCWYNNDSANHASKGKLYNWYAVNDSRGIAPDGWHVPTDGEWNNMIKFLDPLADTVCGGCAQSTTAGGALKQTGTTNWATPNNGATNSSGFNAIASGIRDGRFLNPTINAYWWSTTTNAANTTPAAWSHAIGSSDANEARISNVKYNGYSVRVVRNATTYLWSTGATTQTISVAPTVTTTYYVTINNGFTTCTDSVTVTVSTIPTNLITADTIKVCGTSTTISATTGLASYAWSNGANTASTTITSSGWYKCTATNGACLAKDSVYVSLFNPKITQNDTTVCAGASLTLTVNNNAALTSSLPANLRNGLVGYWPFNGNANDESGNGNNGTVNGATLTADRFGNVGKAYSFNGIDNFIKCLNAGPTGNPNTTASFWLKSNQLSYGHIIGYGKNGVSGNDFRILINGGHAPCGNSIGFDTYDNAKEVTTAFNNTWDFYVVIYEGSIGTNTSIAKIFKNGTLLQSVCFSVNISSTNIASLIPITFGRYHGTIQTGFYNGILDDIAIYSRALSATEIQQLYSLNSTSYLWSTTATTQSITVNPTATTSYIATVSNGINTCKDTVKITVAPFTTNLITADTIKVCGTSTTISATTGLASYAWSNGANTASTSVTSSVWYKCTATNGACTAKDSVYVSLFNPKITQNDTTVCAGAILTLTSMGNVLNNYSILYDFENNISNEFLPNSTFNLYSSKRFGPFSNQTARYTSNSLPTHDSLLIEFDLLIVASWDGAGNYGADIWGWNFGGQNQINTTFAAYYNTNQSFPGSYPGGNYTQTTGSSYGLGPTSANSINGFDTYVYKFNKSFSHNSNSINIEWYANGLESIDNESWALDNLRVTPKNTSTSTILWSTGSTTQSITVNPTATTSYIATVSNGINTCKDTVKITVAPITTNLITADTIKVCGTSTTISATSGLASYAWSNGANTASTSVTSSGWYKCTATNGACRAIDSVYVSLFNPKITQNDTTVCGGTPLTLTVNNNTALTSSLPANLRNGLVGYWPFNGNANDESGNGNNGTVNGATLTSDRFGNDKAYYFDGNAYLQIPNSTSLIVGSQMTISLWLKYNFLNNGANYLIQKGAGHGCLNTGYHVVFDNNQGYSTSYLKGLSYGQQYNCAVIADSSTLDNSWHNITVIYNPPSGNYIFFDGALTNSDLSFCNNCTILNTTDPLIIGATLNSLGLDAAYKWNGKIDDIAIYNRALSANEVQQLYSGNSYLWSTTATTQSITVTPTTTTSYIATVSNGINTCKDTVKITVANITSLAPTTIFGAVDVCAAIGADTASIPVNYKINKIANAASYVWTVPAGAILLSGQGDTSIFVRFRSSFVSGAITVKSVSTCNISSAVKSVTVYKRVAAAPTAIQNQFTPTSIAAVTNVTGSVSQIYRIKKVLYATSYNWFLNRGTNATITHINAAGVNDTAVIVTFASCFVKDTLSVKSVTPCSISAAKTVIMSSSTTPATVAGIGTVGGDFAVCIGSTKTFTAIASTPTTAQVAIASYRWTKPLNTTITSANSDSSRITVVFNAGFTGGNITAKGVSSCGVIGTTAFTAILQYLPPTPLSISASTNSYNACINSSVTYTAIVGAPTTAQAPASVFRWTRPNNTTITSASADSSSITVRFNTGYTGGVISVKGQSRCGTQGAVRAQALTHTGCALGTKMSLPITTTNTPSFEVSLYPNPTTNEFKLLIKNNDVIGTNKPTKAIIKVIDIQGRMMKSFTTNTNQVTAIGNELKAGVYMVEVRMGEEVKTIRAVKF